VYYQEIIQESESKDSGQSRRQFNQLKIQKNTSILDYLQMKGIPIPNLPKSLPKGSLVGNDDFNRLIFCSKQDVKKELKELEEKSNDELDDLLNQTLKKNGWRDVSEIQSNLESAGVDLSFSEIRSLLERKVELGEVEQRKIDMPTLGHPSLLSPLKIKYQPPNYTSHVENLSCECLILSGAGGDDLPCDCLDCKTFLLFQFKLTGGEEIVQENEDEMVSALVNHLQSLS